MSSAILSVMTFLLPPPNFQKLLASANSITADAALPEEVQDNYRYDFRVLLRPQTGPKTDGDTVVRFVREDEMSDEQRKARDVVQTIVRRKRVPV